MRVEQSIILFAIGAATYFVYKYVFKKEDPVKKRGAEMGCFQSRSDDAEPEAIKKGSETQVPVVANTTAVVTKPAAAASKTLTTPSGQPEYSWNKKKLDPKDYTFSNLKGQVCIKEPGTINGQAFIIEDCEDCDIYICDFTAQVQVDYCKNCRIFIGPVESSIFIRNCEKCKCIFACQQLRTRECVDCDTLLFVSTAPVVEMSKNMRFGCFRFFYFSLASQFESAKLSVWDNKWSEIYDFTPADRNWSFLPPDTKASDLIKPLGDLPGGSFVSKEESEEYSDDMVVPVTAGIRQSDFAGQERAFILLLPGKLAEGPTLLSKIPSSCVVIQTKQMQLEAAKVKTLLAECSVASITLAAKGMVVGVEIAGTGALAGAQAAVEAAGGSSVAYASGSEQAAKYEVNVFFEQLIRGGLPNAGATPPEQSQQSRRAVNSPHTAQVT